jgi:hypothetical protein
MMVRGNIAKNGIASRAGPIAPFLMLSGNSERPAVSCIARLDGVFLTA